jgi:hypothetical protein
VISLPSAPSLPPSVRMQAAYTHAFTDSVIVS